MCVHVCIGCVHMELGRAHTWKLSFLSLYPGGRTRVRKNFHYGEFLLRKNDLLVVKTVSKKYFICGLRFTFMVL